jgi:hypothetical protein
MNQKRIITLDGRIKDRHRFLDQITEPIDALVHGRIHANTMLMFFREILKNIYDHAGGTGEMTLEETKRGIDFKIKDFGREAYQLDAHKTMPSSKAGNGVNFGVGLSLINGMAKDLKIIDFRVDCSRGFTYSGVYPYKNKARE